MEDILDFVSLICMLIGGFFFLVGALGLLRMPDLFTRMHATSVGDTMGVGFLIVGMCLQSGLSLVTVKLIFILAVVLFTGAVSSHALARAALHDGRKPILQSDFGRLEETDPVDLFPELGVRLAQPLTSETVVADVPEITGPETEVEASKS
ncbi:MAG: monovalent cation/H(+) antiporter subunit G [Pseudomonadota bacterium]